MKKIVTGTAALLLVILLLSCVSLTDKQIPFHEMETTEIIGQVQTIFHSAQPLHQVRADRIQTQAHSRLLEQAEETFGNNVDVKNISIQGSFSMFNIFPLAYFVALANIQRLTATGDVVALEGWTPHQVVTPQPVHPQQPVRRQDRTPAAAPAPAPVIATGVSRAIQRASNSLTNDLPQNSRIAVISVSSNNLDLSAFVVDGLEFYLFSTRRFIIVDRSTLDAIRAEQNLHVSGDISDASAVSIGNMLGANIVITGNITGIGATQWISLRAIDVQTAQIVSIARESF